MLETILDKFSTSQKRLKLFTKIAEFCVPLFILGLLFFGKMAYQGIQSEVIYFEDNLTYDVITSGRYPQVRTRVDGVIYHSKCRNRAERPNHICRKSFDNQNFIGKNVRFLTYQKENKTNYQGVILGGTFIRKVDNKVFEVKPTDEELANVKSYFNGKIFFLRFWIIATFLGSLIANIAIKLEDNSD